MGFTTKDEDEYVYDGDIVFPSGVVARPNEGYIGINQNWELGAGYDEALEYAIDPTPEKWRLTKDDQVWLADLMIARWTEYRNSLVDEGKTRTYTVAACNGVVHAICEEDATIFFDCEKEPQPIFAIIGYKGQK